MPLVACPDCGSSVSDAAAACPGCGRPLAAGEFEPLPASGDPVAEPGSTDGADLPSLGARPWVRYFARMLDVFIAALLTGVILAVVNPRYLDDPDAAYGITWLSFLVWIPIEAVLLATWGTSPGKALLRTKVVTGEGAVMPSGASLNRAARVWFFGLGTGFPLISLLTMARAHSRLTREGKTSWDRALDLRVQHRPIGPVRVGVAVAILLLIVALSVVPV